MGGANHFRREVKRLCQYPWDIQPSPETRARVRALGQLCGTYATAMIGPADGYGFTTRPPGVAWQAVARLDSCLSNAGDYLHHAWGPRPHNIFMACATAESAVRDFPESFDAVRHLLQRRMP